MPQIQDLYLLYRQTATGPGLVIGNALSERYARGSGVNQNAFPWYTKIRIDLRDTSGGAVGVFQIQSAPDNATWTTGTTFTLTVPSTAPYLAGTSKLFKIPLVAGVWARFLRINISSLTGGTTPTADAYCTGLGYGT